MTTPVTRSSNDHLTNLEVSDVAGTDASDALRPPTPVVGGKDASSASTPTLMAMVDNSTQEAVSASTSTSASPAPSASETAQLQLVNSLPTTTTTSVTIPRPAARPIFAETADVQRGNSKDIAIPLEPSIAQMTPAPSSTTVVMEAEGEDSPPLSERTSKPPGTAPNPDAIKTSHAAFEAIGLEAGSGADDTASTSSSENHTRHNAATPTPVIVIKDADDEGDDSPKCREEALRRGTKYMDTTVHYRNMPAWFHDDVYILTGYRRIQFTYRGCFRSLFYIHNETGNVYTHLIGTVLFLILIGLSFARSSSSSSTAPLSPNDTIIIITTSVPTAISTTFSSLPTTMASLPIPTAVAFSPIYTPQSGSNSFNGLLPIGNTTTAYDIVVVCVFLMSAVLCLGLSTTYHLCCCHSMEVSKAWNKADYVGIVFLIVGSFIPAVYYGFYCYRTLQLIYIPTMVFFGLATAIVTMSKRFSTPKYRYLRTTLFLALGLAGVVPLAHVLIIYKPEFAAEAMALRYVGAMGLMYILGAALYASRVPERWFPGKFDIWFQSHQLFHVLVVMAAVTHYIGLMKAYRFWHESGVRCDQL